MEKVDVTKIKAIQTMPNLASKDTDWIKWVDFVMAQYGRTLGTQIFINTWQKRGSRNANSYTIRKHLKSNYDIEIEESVWDNVVDVAGGIGEGFNKAMKVGKITAMVIVGIIGITIVGVAVNLIRNPSNALLATPQGRALKMRGGLRR